MKKIIVILILLISGINVIAQTYNPEKAAEYASFWCDKRNTLNSPYLDTDKWGGPYIDYDSWGGDCAAFVSQCLIYGGLDLSKGTDGNGAYVKPDKVISGASELVLHLASWQNTSYKKVFGYNPPSELGHDLGDPAFFGYSGNGIEASHSYICSSLDWDARHLYSAHTGERCNDELSETWGYLIFFHIKSAYPDHCFDCEKNFDEEGKDCGGSSCPPCEHAPDQVIINTATNNLPSDVRAIKKITAGNAAVKVLSGQDVTFTTAGEIELLPGFEVDAGANFISQAKGHILEVTADCNEICDPGYLPGLFFRWYQYMLVDVANVKRIELEIVTQDKNSVWHTIRYVNIENQEGTVLLWNLIDGDFDFHLKPDGYSYSYEYAAIYYGCYQYWRYWQRFGINNPKNKSLNSEQETEETETSDPFLSPSVNSTPQIEKQTDNFFIIPNPNSGTFQIEPNFPLSDIAHLKVVDVMGTTVYETQNVTANTIQLQTPAQGQFFVVVFLKEGGMITKKMLIQR